MVDFCEKETQKFSVLYYINPNNIDFCLLNPNNIHFFKNLLLNIHLRVETEQVPCDVDAEAGGCGGCVDRALLVVGLSGTGHVWTCFEINDACDDDGVVGGCGNCPDEPLLVVGLSASEHVGTCFGSIGSCDILEFFSGLSVS